MAGWDGIGGGTAQEKRISWTLSTYASFLSTLRLSDSVHTTHTHSTRLHYLEIRYRQTNTYIHL